MLTVTPKWWLSLVLIHILIPYIPLTCINVALSLNNCFLSLTVHIPVISPIHHCSPSFTHKYSQPISQHLNKQGNGYSLAVSMTASPVFAIFHHATKHQDAGSIHHKPVRGTSWRHISLHRGYKPLVGGWGLRGKWHTN